MYDDVTHSVFQCAALSRIQRLLIRHKNSQKCVTDVVGDMCPPPPFLFCAPARDMCPLSMGENGFLRNWVFVDLFMLGSFSLTYFCWECLAVMRQTLLRPRYCVCV